MKITYIHHSSFLAELSRFSLLFDYYTGEIPETDRNKPMVFFSSHRHWDHFSPDIFRLGSSGKMCVLSCPMTLKRAGFRTGKGRELFLSPRNRSWRFLFPGKS